MQYPDLLVNVLSGERSATREEVGTAEKPAFGYHWARPRARTVKRAELCLFERTVPVRHRVQLSLFCVLPRAFYRSECGTRNASDLVL